jgi:hypothetical protein
MRLTVEFKLSLLPRRGRLGKYDPLRSYLESKSPSEITLTMSFSEIEKRVGRLPTSARQSRSWWTSTRSASRGAHGWLTANWRINSVDLDSEQVIFARDPAVAASMPSGQDAPVRATGAGDHRAGKASRRARAGGIGAAVVAAAAAGASELIGVAHLPWPALLSLALGVGAIAWIMTQAIQETPERAYWLWLASTVLLVIFAAGTFVYHKGFDPATRPHRTYQFVVNGGEDNVISLFGEAGGPVQALATGTAGQNGLIGGQTYVFDCWTVGRDGAEWLRYERFNHSWWAPRKYLHPPFGELEPPLPHC